MQHADRAVLLAPSAELAAHRREWIEPDPATA
jgi:hypothetical protein